MDIKLSRIYAHRKFKSKDPVLMFEENTWDDFGFRTLFNVYFFKNNEYLFLGYTNIAEKNAKKTSPFGYSTVDYLFKDNREKVIDFPLGVGDLISLGQPDYYKELHKFNDQNLNIFKLLEDLGDLANDLNLFSLVKENEVVENSFLRGVSEFVVKEELHPLATSNKKKEYTFIVQYKDAKEIKSQIKFHTNPDYLLPTNVHALIGNNGSGKTTFLKDLVDIARNGNNISVSNFNKKNESELSIEIIPENNEITSIQNIYEIFESVLFISFSAFDTFDFQNDKGNIEGKFSYITLFNRESALDSNSNDVNENTEVNVQRIDLISQYKTQLKKIYSSVDMIEGLQEAHRKLNLFFHSIYTKNYNAEESDAENQVDNSEGNEEIEKLINAFSKYSSGQKIMLLSITALIASVRQQTLVIFDEPELYLHPPMATSFIRMISEIMQKKNGVSILATHSPIILQEIPKNCVHLVEKDSKVFKTMSPQSQTFGENVSILNDQVFGLDIRESGFYNYISEYYRNEALDNKLLDDIELGSDAENYLELLKLRDLDAMDGDMDV